MHIPSILGGPVPFIAAASEVIPGISGITVRRGSHAFFDSIDP